MMYKTKLLFVSLEFLYAVVFAFLLGDLSLFLASLFLMAIPIFRSDNRSMMSFSILLRIILFSWSYGIHNCNVYLTGTIVYIRFMLDDESTYGILRSAYFFCFIMIMDNIPIPCVLPFNIIIRINKITRIYLLTYCFCEVLEFKYTTIQKEKELANEAFILQNKEDEELKFMLRFSHFSKTNLNGALNFLAFFLENRNEDENRVEDELKKSDKKEKERIRTCFESVKRSIGDITSQLSDFVEFYHYRRGDDEFKECVGIGKKEICNIRKITKYITDIQTCLRLAPSGKKSEKLELLVNINKNVPNVVYLESFLLSRVLNNLISNSIKYTNEGTVSVILDSEDDINNNKNKNINKNTIILKIRIMDTGVGISKDMLSKIFDPFVRNNLKKDSFSIGLVITKQIVEKKLNGTIKIKSEGIDGKGTVATVKIPVYVPSYEEIEKLRRIKEEESFKILVCSNESRLKSILIVEDNLINRKVLEKQIELIVNPVKRGIEVYQAIDGLDGLEKLSKIQEENPIIICDIDMPRLNGFQFIRECRKLCGPRLVCYSVTATIVTSYKRFKTAGFDGVEPKPVALSRMRKVLSEMLKLRNDKLMIYASSVEKKNQKNIVPCILASPPKTTKTRNELASDANDSFVQFSLEPDETPKNLENFREEVLTQNEKEMESRFIFADFFFSFLTFLLILELYFPLPNELQHGWLLYLYTFLILCLIQYPLFLIFRWKFQTNSIISILRLISCVTVPSEYSFFMLLENFYYCQFPVVVLAVLTIKSFYPALVVSSLFYLQLVFYELKRNDDYFFICDEFFFSVIYQATLYYFVLFMICLLVFFSYSENMKKAKWKEIIEEKKIIEYDFNQRMSKVSHDLSTPIAGVVCNLELLKDLLGLPIEDKTMKYLMQSSISLDYSVHNFLIACKIKNGMFQRLLTTRVRIKEFLELIIERLMFLKGGETNIQVSFRNEDGTSIEDNLYVLIDLNGVRLVIINLIVNTIVHSKASKIKINMGFLEDIQPRQEDISGTPRMIKFSIIDNGIGIKKQFLDFDVMEKEFKDFRFKERFPSSLGLGLTVSKILSRKLGGDLVMNTYPKNEQPRIEYEEDRDIDSMDKKGTSFIFSFPIALDEYDGISEESEGEEQNMEQYLRKRRISKIKLSLEQIDLLCIDDCVIFNGFMKFFTEQLGFRNVDVTISAVEAIRMMKEKKYGLLISDFNLNSMDAIDMYNKVIEENGNLPDQFVVVSGESELKIMERGRGVIDGFIPKPVSIVALRICLSNFYLV